MTQSIVIFGASTRAAAFSALRAGLQPWCADLFGDVDLGQRCPCEVLDHANYPNGFLDIERRAPPGPWMYTGALENRPDLIRELAGRRPLWGNDAETLAVVRSPVRVQALLTAQGIPCPVVQTTRAKLDRHRRWLVKPWRSAGGAHIRFVDEKGAPRRRVYFQEFVEGLPCAAIYLGDGRHSELIGVTEQLVGESWLNAAPFHYCGSIGPLALDEAQRQAFVRLGEALAAGSGLRGIFGIDCILRDGVPWPVEINPRYTSSVEVLEYAIGCSVLRAAGFIPDKARAQRIVGKAIVFARQAFVFPSEGPWQRPARPLSEMPAYADIPRAGSRILRGQPILTLFAQADSMAAFRQELQQKAFELERFILT